VLTVSIVTHITASVTAFDRYDSAAPLPLWRNCRELQQEARLLFISAQHAGVHCGGYIPAEHPQSMHTGKHWKMVCLLTCSFTFYNHRLCI